MEISSVDEYGLPSEWGGVWIFDTPLGVTNVCT